MIRKVIVALLILCFNKGFSQIIIDKTLEGNSSSIDVDANCNGEYIIKFKFKPSTYDNYWFGWGQSTITVEHDHPSEGPFVSGSDVIMGVSRDNWQTDVVSLRFILKNDWYTKSPIEVKINNQIFFRADPNFNFWEQGKIIYINVYNSKPSYELSALKYELQENLQRSILVNEEGRYDNSYNLPVSLSDFNCGTFCNTLKSALIDQLDATITGITEEFDPESEEYLYAITYSSIILQEAKTVTYHPYSTESKIVDLKFALEPDNQEGVVPIKVRINYLTKGTSSGEIDINDINTFSIPYEIDRFGEHRISYQMLTGCGGEWSPEDFITIQALPSCAGNTLTNQYMHSATAVGINEFRLDEERTYDANINGITDLDEHYDFVFSTDAEGAELVSEPKISHSVGSVTLHDKNLVGKYYLTPAIKADRAGLGCPEHLDPDNPFPAMEIFVGGQDETIISDCPIEIPYDIDSRIVNGNELSTFETEIKSSSNIVVYNVGGDGLVLKKGAKLSIDKNTQVDAGDAFALDNSKTYSLNKSYDDFGRLTGSGIAYYDNGGRVIQSQSLNLDKATVLATETKEDEYGRPVLTTLAAPVQQIVQEGDSLCDASSLEVSAKIPYVYKENFALADVGIFKLSLEPIPDLDT